MKKIDEILSNYESPHDCEEIKKGMDEDLELYKQGKLETKALGEDWSHLETEIQKGIDSRKSAKSHEDIIKSISANYANKL